MKQRGSKDPDLKMLRPETLPLSSNPFDLNVPRQAIAARESKAVTRLRISLAI